MSRESVYEIFFFNGYGPEDDIDYDISRLGIYTSFSMINIDALKKFYFDIFIDQIIDHYNLEDMSSKEINEEIKKLSIKKIIKDLKPNHIFYIRETKLNKFEYDTMHDSTVRETKYYSYIFKTTNFEKLLEKILELQQIEQKQKQGINILKKSLKQNKINFNREVLDNIKQFQNEIVNEHH
jgi:hypothetical protein